MSRTALPTDVFGPLAEPSRRAILDLLKGDERAVNDVVEALGMPQPAVSKQLTILRKAGLVRVRREGRYRFYRTNGERLKPVHDWAKTYEQYWTRQLARVKTLAEAKTGGRSRGKKR